MKIYIDNNRMEFFAESYNLRFFVFFFRVYTLFIRKRNAVYNHIEPLPIIMFPCLPPSPPLSRSAVLETFIPPLTPWLSFGKITRADAFVHGCDKWHWTTYEIPFYSCTRVYTHTYVYTYTYVYMYGFLPRSMACECKRPMACVCVYVFYIHYCVIKHCKKVYDVLKSWREKI